MRECTWPGNNVKMRKYHDEEWCIPSHDDRFIFEMLNFNAKYFNVLHYFNLSLIFD